MKTFSPPVNGLMPLHAFFAGIATAMILRMPGSTNVRGPLLLIEARGNGTAALVRRLTPDGRDARG